MFLNFKINKFYIWFGLKFISLIKKFRKNTCNLNKILYFEDFWYDMFNFIIIFLCFPLIFKNI